MAPSEPADMIVAHQTGANYIRSFVSYSLWWLVRDAWDRDTWDREGGLITSTEAFTPPLGD
jgi:hypothetical protein